MTFNTTFKSYINLKIETLKMLITSLLTNIFQNG